ncbi:type II toxin-antitoxin system VapC family toxin [Leptospira sp. 2 VSF19]|uniref:Type II toxin-antitoxin system VapC family toxin n=1 Tax=Leptospira soteropolitanensis TaxID=2950025 RepID=A0AAW5VU47_9LEPT|nr:type II toxin-antitoxin system VapC family toxin [Leptospira soteropolitanensis]MCW7494720.1 type II toxin-antitoxin system VapC family toxin [Leptospira soteropolitanensis]MCW7502287.1 type II toxin-antitoxin system VapC family toxin [Leptospira soteropolitanensis]MCW7524549.1 type II toxin-antitoxin system VapC family toxin [Leptospira soteropolitanensis]MCW7528419.1 type II toxin-antitoxin system VapC family toxin [Leptospira soteropolitanensis]MCW7532234.1 type II toxin-antitoxin system
MAYLLDTHALLWVIGDSKQLSKKITTIVQDQENQIFVSVISLWEISLKFKLGKLKLSGFKPEDIPKLLEKLNINIIELNQQEASSYHHLKEDFHRDPFDRMLIWQCISRKLTFISKDSEIKKYRISGLKTIWS